MPTDLVSRLNLDLLYAPFLERLLELLANCRSTWGQDFVAYSGFRTYAEQDTLHKAYISGKGGIAAPPGLSSHNYGLAVDVARDINLVKPGLQPVWDKKDYLDLGFECKRLGLVWGGDFNDCVHVQMPGYVTGGQLAPLRVKWMEVQKGPLVGQNRAALQEVWKLVDAKRAAG